MQVELGSYIYISLFALGAWGRGVLWNTTGRFPLFANNNNNSAALFRAAATIFVRLPAIFGPR